MTNKCYSANSENYLDESEYAIDEVLSNCETLEEALESTISVGDTVRPYIDVYSITDNIIEHISEDLYESCGEISEAYIVTKYDYQELRDFLQVWVDKQDFRCYSVENAKDVKLTDLLEIKDIEEYFK